MLLLVPVQARADTESYWLAKHRAGVDRAVKKALAFMAKRLGSDASFASEVKGMNAVAGLAGMAFLSVGHTPGRGPYGDVVNRCIDFVLATPSEGSYGGAAKGWLARENTDGRMYSHSISTLFLCEVSGMVNSERQKKIDVLLPKALKLILTAQAVQKKDPRHAGGWRYHPDSTDSDLSASGWCLMALRSARLNGAPVPAEAIKKALEFVNRCYDPAKGGFDYQPGKGSMTPAVSAVGLLCRELSGHHNDAINRRCGDHLSARTSYKGVRVYEPYYVTQAMFQLGGKYWERYAPLLYKGLIASQRDDGSWVGGRRTYGLIYPTSMCVLALTVSYHQLPIYQR
jgi:hypothetical protein